MKLDPVLLEILVCPDCKGSLTVDQDHDELICNGCGLIYPVRDDIPIMLVEEARRPEPPAADAATEAADTAESPKASEVSQDGDPVEAPDGPSGAAPAGGAG